MNDSGLEMDEPINDELKGCEYFRTPDVMISNSVQAQPLNLSLLKRR